MDLTEKTSFPPEKLIVDNISFLALVWDTELAKLPLLTTAIEDGRQKPRRFFTGSE